MPSRALGNKAPEVQVVDMREELREGNRSMFSRSLHAAISARLERGEQTVFAAESAGLLHVCHVPGADMWQAVRNATFR